MSWMRSIAIIIGAVSMVAMQSATAHAQQSSTPQRHDTATHDTTVGQGAVMSAPPHHPSYSGFGYGGTAMRGPDGYAFAGYPTIRRLDPGSPAANAGLALGDSIISVNGAAGQDPKSYRVLGELGKVVIIRVRRGNELREYTIVTATNWHTPRDESRSPKQAQSTRSVPSLTSTDFPATRTALI